MKLSNLFLTVPFAVVAHCASAQITTSTISGRVANAHGENMAGVTITL